MRSNHRWILLLLASLASCSSATLPVIPAPPPPPPNGTLRLIFAGNSLTETNDVPGQVSRMAVAAGFAVPVIRAIVVGGYSLEDHWNDGLVAQAMQSTSYDYLIMQQGPSTLASSGVNLTEYAGKFADAARLRGTRPAIYVVWPPKGGDLDAGIANHEAAANTTQSALFPVGEAWRNAWSRDAAMPLYGGDNFHPSEHGSWLAALVIVAMIYDRPVTDFPNLFPDKISSSQEADLRAAATLAIQQRGRR